MIILYLYKCRDEMIKLYLYKWREEIYFLGLGFVYIHKVW